MNAMRFVYHKSYTERMIIIPFLNWRHTGLLCFGSRYREWKSFWNRHEICMGLKCSNNHTLMRWQFGSVYMSIFRFRGAKHSLAKLLKVSRLMPAPPPVWSFIGTGLVPRLENSGNRDPTADGHSRNIPTTPPWAFPSWEPRWHQPMVPR